uniref:Putative secreted protein n=1 Tax=Anopheles marajoara TaxID=58244 RepID=A0A2M4CA02_9DIPT
MSSSTSSESGLRALGATHQLLLLLSSTMAHVQERPYDPKTLSMPSLHNSFEQMIGTVRSAMVVCTMDPRDGDSVLSVPRNCIWSYGCPTV